MTTINDLAGQNSAADADKVAIWSDANNATRALRMDAVATYMDDKLGTTTMAQDIAQNSADIATKVATTDLAANGGAGLVGWLRSATGTVKRWLSDKLGEFPSVMDWGAVGDNTTADNASIQTAVNNSPSNTVYVPSAIYKFAGYINTTAGQALRLIGRGPGVSIFRSAVTGSAAQTMLTMRNTSYSRIEDIGLDVTIADNTASGHPISMIDVNDTKVRNVSITGLAGTGSALLIYPALTTDYVQRVRLEDLTVIGNPGTAAAPNSTNTNGPLIVNGRYCQMRGIYAEGIVQYAIEYKNDTAWCTLADLISVNSLNGIGFGQTTSDATGVSYTAVSNFVTKDCAQGVTVGKGGYNAFSNGVMHIASGYSGPGAGNNIGVRTSGSSVGNSFSNMLIAGSVVEAVRLGSLRNYVSASLHTSSTMVTLEAGAFGNVVEVQHPGTRTTILASVSDSSGNTALSGANANPIYCHATGEYRGIISDRWRWTYDATGNAPGASAHRWIYEAKGDAFASIMSDGTGTNGYTVSAAAGVRGLYYSWASDYWRLYGSTGGYRFYPTVFRAETDIAVDLGAAAVRFKTGYLQNVVLTPPASVTPASNGQMTFELTSDTQLKIKVKGSDGVVRSTSLTLA